MGERQLAFVAYPSKHQDTVSLLREAISRANAKPIDIQYEPWEFNDIAGEPIISPIIENIDRSAFVVADITHLNPNVVYEIGYAIGCKKRVFLVRHAKIPGDRDTANRVGIFDTLGYFEYQSADALSQRLTSHIEQRPIDFSEEIDHRSPVYVVEPPKKGDAATMMVSRLKKARYRYRSFNPTEDSRLSAVDAIRQVATSAGVMVHLEDEAREWAEIHNLRTMFVAGLADGISRPCLILSPAGFRAPLDVRDDVKVYAHPDDISAYVAAFVLELTERLQQVDPPLKGAQTSLQSLTFGDPTAENEMTTLGVYYMQTNEFRRALRGEVNLVVGRKGSGKTALFLQLRDKIRSDKRNVVVDLKPEGYQLIKLKENILSYLTEGSRQHLVTAFWEYLLMLEVTYKVLEKDRIAHKHNHDIYQMYVDLEASYKTEDFSAEGDFSERLLTLSNRIASEYQARFGSALKTQLTVEDVTSLVYAHDIRALRERLVAYLDTKQSVWILFDNLDKGWNTGGVDETDTTVLRCLIEAGRKFERDMRKRNHSLVCLVFVRNDVYELLMASSADYGKDMRVVLDWTDPDMLREMLRLRLVAGMDGVDGNAPFDKVWRTIAVSHYRGEDAASYIIERSLMRPRNVLKLFAHSLGFANNFNHVKIEESDIEKGTKTYSQDLLIEVDRELGDVFPKAPNVLYSLLDQPKEIKRVDLRGALSAEGLDETDAENVIEFLVYYGVLGLRSDEGVQYIFDVNYDSKILRARAKRQGDQATLVVNPAFWDALGITNVRGDGVNAWRH